MKGRLLTLLFGAIFLWLSHASAQDTKSEGQVSVTFEFRAPTTCPSEGVAFALIQRHAKRIVRSESPTESVAAMRIRITEVPGGHKGELSVQRPGGETETRDVKGTTCREVMEALALTAALSVDPDASLFSDSSTDSTSESHSEAKTERHQSETLGSAQSGADKNSKGSEPTEDARLDVHSNQTEVHIPLTYSIGPDFSIEGVLSHSEHLGVGVSLSLRREDARIFLPLEVKAGFRFLFEGPFNGSEELTSSLGVVTLEGCPLRIGAKLSVMTCFGFDLGWVSVTGQNLEDPANSTRSYAALKTEVPIQLRLSSVEIWGAPGLSMPLTRRSFVAEPGSELLSETKAVGIFSTIGARIEF